MAESMREQVFLAAAEEFASKGYSGTSFASIAARAGVTRSVVQHWAPSKSRLAQEIALEPFKTGADPSLATGGIRQLLALIRHTGAEYATSVFNRASTRLMLERESVPAELPVPFLPWIPIVSGLLEEAIEDGDVARGTDGGELAERLIAAFSGCKQFCDATGRLDELPDRSVAVCQDILAAHRPT